MYFIKNKNNLYISQSIFNSHDDMSFWALIPLLFSLVVSFTFMALYNVQDYIENPFDQKGLDDLKHYIETGNLHPRKQNA